MASIKIKQAHFVWIAKSPILLGKSKLLIIDKMDKILMSRIEVSNLWTVEYLNCSKTVKLQSEC